MKNLKEEEKQMKYIIMFPGSLYGTEVTQKEYADAFVALEDSKGYFMITEDNGTINTYHWSKIERLIMKPNEKS